MKVKEEREKAGLKLNNQKTKIMAFGPITSWQIDGETMETVKDFIFLGSKITANGDYSHEIKRRLFLGRKAITNLDSIIKSRDVTLPTKVHLVKAKVFPVALYRCESWTIRRLSVEELMLLNCGVGEDSWESLGQQGDQTSHSWRKTVLNIHWKDWCWSWNSNTLATWCEELTHLKRPWCWERSKAGGDGDDRGRDGWMASLTQWRWVWVNRELVMDREAWGNAVHGVTKSRTWLNDWTELNDNVIFLENCRREREMMETQRQWKNESRPNMNRSSK